jgi:L-threonylcarbamoyladenylate synthase
VKTKVSPALTSADRDEAVSQAVELLQKGEAIGLPTETVYGLAADALREEAVLKIFAAKARPRFDPLIVHLPDLDWVERMAVIADSSREIFNRLHTSFWPGPLTFVLPRRPIVPDAVTAGLDTVAIRISSHPIFSEIIRAFQGPLAAPSANRFGRVSPTAATHVLEELDGFIPLIVDAGPTAHGLESTIIALRNERIELLRRGPVTDEQLVEFGQVVAVGPTPHPEAPGQLPSHYAPKTPLIFVDDAAAFLCPVGNRCGLLSWRTKTRERFAEIRLLSERQNLTEAASNLFRCLRELDNEGLDLIVAEKLPDEGLGAAMNDRLRRAATTTQKL